MKHPIVAFCLLVPRSKYVDHVTCDVRPLMKELKFAFDFGHLCDGWDSLIMAILNETRDIRALVSVDATVCTVFCYYLWMIDILINCHDNKNL